MDDNIIRILISTDNHLGYMEKDPIRCNDSLAAFEEALYTAKKSKADFTLLAGDLFHENKPSRRTLHGCIELLRKYCYGGDPVYIEMLNEQSEVFKNRSGVVNYEDPFQSISLPVFAIHGNHDDPSREGGDETLSAMDLLAASNMLNYFGKAEQVDNIDIVPILLRKGDTLVALYGLGAIRDERLNRMWNQRKLRFVRPPVEQDRDNFFNIFVLHQNRDYGRGAKNCVHESMIPEWMDLVVWGNEHECKTSLAESLVGTFRIYQPGSSVATSLVDGESSLSNPKHMGLIEIKTRKFRLNPIPYTQIRSFVYDDISLSDGKYKLDKNDPKIEDKIKDILSMKIKNMIQIARGHSSEIIPYYADDNTSDNTNNDSVASIKSTYVIKDPQFVLVRLRIDHQGFPTIHPQRFGSQFVGQVANPGELLLFSKTSRTKDKMGTGGFLVSDSETHSITKSSNDSESGIHAIKVEDLVKESLLRSKHMNILPELKLSDALENFVTKRQLGAIHDVVSEALVTMQKALGQNTDKTCNTKNAIIEAVSKVKEASDDGIRRKLIRQQMDEEQKHDVLTGNQKNIPLSDISDDDKSVQPKKKATRGKMVSKVTKTTASKTTSKKKRKFEDSESEVEAEEPSDVDSGSDSEMYTNHKAKNNSTIRNKRESARTATKKKTKYAVDSESDVEFGDEIASNSNATSKNQSKYTEIMEIVDSDDDAPVIENTVKKTGKTTAKSKAASSSRATKPIQFVTSSRNNNNDTSPVKKMRQLPLSITKG